MTHFEGEIKKIVTVEGDLYKVSITPTLYNENYAKLEDVTFVATARSVPEAIVQCGIEMADWCSKNNIQLY